MATEQKTYELIVEPRKLIGKQSKQLRRQELLPGVVYGHNVEPQSVQVAQRELDRVYLRAGSNMLVDLKLNGETRKVFIHNVQRAPTTHLLTHVDFMVVNLREEIHTTVPLVLVGDSPIVVRNEGLMSQLLDHVMIKALPMDIIPMIEVDVSGLDEIGKAIHVSDLKVPSNITVLTGEDELVAKVTDLPVAEVVEEAPAEEAEGAEGESSDDSDSGSSRDSDS